MPMHAIQLHAFGPPENLVYEEVPEPAPAESQVRIAVEASGVHFVDASLRRGVAMGAAALPALPLIPGREVAGVVDAIGAGVDERQLGRRVVAHLGAAGGGYAERAIARAAAVHEIPEALDSGAAVAMVGTGRTAFAILDVAGLSESDVVVVTAAAGGLGSLLVQAATRAGALVVGLAGASKLTQVRALGAAIAADHDDPGWVEQVREALGERAPSVVLDGVGGATGRAAFELLAPGGRVVLFGWSSGAPTRIATEDLFGRSLTATVAIGPRLMALPGGLRALEARALEAAAAGHLVPLLQRFPLAEAARAHAAIEARKTVGKTLLIP